MQQELCDMLTGDLSMTRVGREAAGKDDRVSTESDRLEAGREGRGPWDKKGRDVMCQPTQP